MMETTHACLWPGCGEPVRADRWACRPHWCLLPHNLRSWLGRAYWQGIERGDHPSRSYLDARCTTLEWIRLYSPGSRAQRDATCADASSNVARSSPSSA